MDINPLSDLRDVIYPVDPGFWPPAIGWWILLVLVILCLIGVVYLFRSIYVRMAETSFVKEVDALAQLQPRKAVVELSILMRRIAITRFPRDSVAGLSGEDWLQFLDQSGNTDQFTAGPGRVLVSAPYSDLTPENLDPLFRICRDWAKSVTT
ncbi:MAG: DUF4381 domain-containing protein [Gammaproteobacteria bacterium]|nr:DUF4381 domain-containing protein [Gammaproteobacteria bacterium]